MVSLVIVSPSIPRIWYQRPLKTTTHFEWSIHVFEHSYYITILGIFSLIINIVNINIVNIEKFQSLQASKG
ncbi:hypothetical protein VN0773_11420 [Helicobacter pylori]